MLTNQTDTELINLTPAALNIVKDMIAERNLEDFALRLFISGGGCSGYRYGMALDNNIRENDLSVDFDNVKVVVDEVSIDYLRGATIDYVENEGGSGFSINSPIPLPSCSCGSGDSSCSGCG